MGSLVISDRTFSQVQEMASTESSTGVMIEGNYRRGKQINWFTASHHRRLCVKQQASLRICSKSLNRFMMDKLHTSTDCKMAGLTLVVRSRLITTLPQHHPGLSLSEAQICTPAGFTKATAHRGAGWKFNFNILWRHSTPGSGVSATQKRCLLY